MPPNAPHRDRRSIRLSGYDYTQPAAYFVTICTFQRQPILGHIVDGHMHLSQAGRIASQYWQRLPRHFPNVRLDAWVIMPNHVHAILGIVPAPDDHRSTVEATHSPPDDHRDTVGATHSPSDLPEDNQPDPAAHSLSSSIPGGNASPTSARAMNPGPPSRSLGAIIGSYKSTTARRINQVAGAPGQPVWQRNYYEHIVRSQHALHAIRDYILTNPLRWHLDRLNPDAAGPDPRAAGIAALLGLDSRH